MAEVKAASPAGKVVGVFVPKEKFNWITYDAEGIPSVMGVYLPGKRYYLREGNAKLDAQLKEWVAEGKVTYSAGV